MTNNFNQSDTFILFLYAQYLRFWEQWLKEILSHVIRGNQLKSIFCFYGHHKALMNPA